MIRKFLRMLFSLKRKQQIPSLPRMISNHYDHRVSREVEKVFAQTQARSPENVRAMMKQYKVDTVDELLELLPTRQRRADPRKRLRRWLARINGLTLYEPVVRPALRRMEGEGTIPRGTLIRRSKVPDATP